MKYLTIIQFGPVQDFIQTARRTDDYWAGSFLLSYTANVIIKALTTKGAEIISPCSESISRVSAKENTLPNRIVALVEAENSNSLKKYLNEDVKELTLKELVLLFENTEKKLISYPLVSEKQVRDLFEFFYAFVEYDGKDYGSSLKRVEEIMVSRKNIRDFKSFTSQGYKCTQCGVREPLRDSTIQERDSSDLVALEHYWKKFQIGRYAHTFKKNERLCSICAGKRLLRDNSEFKDKGGIPSTSTIAISAWLPEFVQKAEPGKVDNFIRNLCMVKIPHNTTPVHKNSKERSPLFNIEGDCFFPESYYRFEKEADDSSHNNVRDARKALKEMLSNIDPPKYYSILHLDGDSIGKKLHELKDDKEHKKFSRTLSAFTQEVYRTIAENFHGYVVYFGGDEGVILTPLSETLDIMEKLRLKFFEMTNCTLSAGVAIVHHHAPLGEGLKVAGEVLHIAKKKVKDKNAFAIKIQKRSGSHVLSVSPWEIQGQGIIDFLKEWLALYQDKKLSPRWYYQFSAMESTIPERNDPSFTENELYHILPRHMAKSRDIALSLIKKTSKVIYSYDLNFSNFLSLLHVPLYVYRGGKD